MLEPIENSSMFVLPIMMPSASSIRSTTVALYGGLNSLSILEAHVVSLSLTHMLSFNAIGSPLNGPIASPRIRRWSIFSARPTRSSASSSEIKACTSGSTDSIRESTDRITSAAETSFASSCRESSTADSNDSDMVFQLDSAIEACSAIPLDIRPNRPKPGS